MSGLIGGATKEFNLLCRFRYQEWSWGQPRNKHDVTHGVLFVMMRLFTIIVAHLLNIITTPSNFDLQKSNICEKDISNISRTNFKPGSCPDDLLEICYFYISQTKLSLDKIFYKVVYHHIIYMCDFLVNLDDFFAVICKFFFTKLWFALDMSPT